MESTQYSTLSVGGLPAGFAQRCPLDASHATLRPALGPADGTAKILTPAKILSPAPPPAKILTPAPPLVAPPAHLMIRAKSANPIPKWKQPQPGAPYISLRRSGPPAASRPLSIQIDAPCARSIPAALTHSGLPLPLAVDSLSLVKNTEEELVVSPPAAAQRPSPVQTAGPPKCKQRACSRLAVADTSAANSCPSIDAPVEGVDVSTLEKMEEIWNGEKWVEIWDNCWRLTAAVARRPPDRSDFDDAMMTFHKLARLEHRRPLQTRSAHPVSVTARRLADFYRSPSHSRSRSPSHATSREFEGSQSAEPQPVSCNRSSRSRSHSGSHVIL
jgi:hypothetical protein